MLRVKSWYHIALIHLSTHHHIHPLVQLYQLFVVLKEKFFLKDQLPKPKEGIFEAYREIIPTLIKQAKNPYYILNINLPKN